MRKYWLSVLLLGIVGCSSTIEERAANITDPLAAAKTRIALGLSYLEANNFKQAKYNIDKALGFAPRFANAHFAQAFYLQTVNEPDLAEKSYQTALDLAPNNPEIANSYGAFLCAQGRYTEASKQFKSAIAHQDYLATAESYENLGLCAQAKGDTPAAIKYFQKALNHQPNRAKTHWLLAECFQQEKEYNRALQALGQFERISGMTVDSVYMTYEIAKAQNNTRSVNAWAKMLQTRFPQHPLAKQVATEMQVQAISAESITVNTTKILSPDMSAWRRHVLARGETLYRLSQLYQVRVQDIINWNDLSDVNRLKVGQSLIVGPVPSK